jgi:hypothetical protein
LNLTPPESLLWTTLSDFCFNSGETPSLQHLQDVFEGLNNVQVGLILDEMEEQPFYEGASFLACFEFEVEAQSLTSFQAIVRTSVDIANRPKDSKQGGGVSQAVSYLFTEAKPTPMISTGRLSHIMTENKDDLSKLYWSRKNSPTRGYGISTGLSLFDESTGGLRKKQLHLLAGFGGHLKSTLMFDMIVRILPCSLFVRKSSFTIS